MDLTMPTVRHCGRRLLELAEAMEDQATPARLPALLERTYSGEFRVVVVGEIKKGKSSFINALLGYPDLLPALSDVATSTVFQVAYGESLSYRVHFQADPSNPASEPRTISADEVAEYGTEDGNPNNARGVDYIAVELPHPLLQQGLRIVDTPGLGGLFKSHAEILWRYAPEADAVFFVLDSVEAVASRPEMEALERLRRMTPLLFFVQTKTDLAAQEQWRAWQQRNLTILAETLAVKPETLRYFPVSAKLKQAADRRQSSELLRDSGYESLLAFLKDDLMAFKEAYLAGQLLAALAVETKALHQRGTEQERVLNAKTKEELEALGEKTSSARSAFRKWKERIYPEIKGDFEHHGKTLKSELSNELKSRLDSGAAGPIVGPIMQLLRTTDEPSEQLVNRFDTLRSEAIDRCVCEMRAVHAAYKQRMQTLIISTLNELDSGAQVSIPTSDPVLTVDPRLSIADDPAHWFDSARNIAHGARLSTGVLGTGLIALGAVFTPVAAALAVPILLGGLLAGVVFSYQSMDAKRRDKVLSKLQKDLSDETRKAQQQAVQQFAALAEQVEYTMSRALRQIVESRSERLDEQLAQIESARRQTTEEKTLFSERLKAQLTQLTALRDDIERLRR